MSAFRTAADHPAEERPPAAARGRKTPPRASEPALEEAQSIGPVAARLQARLEAIEADPEALEGRRPHPRTERPPALPATSAFPTQTDAIADLNNQLEVLRDQLEVAFDDVDARIQASDQRAAAALARVDEVVAAVEELATELHGVDSARPVDLDRLRTAVARFRQHLGSH